LHISAYYVSGKLNLNKAHTPAWTTANNLRLRGSFAADLHPAVRGLRTPGLHRFFDMRHRCDKLSGFARTLVHRQKIGNRYVDRVCMYGVAPRFAPYLAVWISYKHGHVCTRASSRWGAIALKTTTVVEVRIDHLSFKYKEV